MMRGLTRELRKLAGDEASEEDGQRARGPQARRAHPRPSQAGPPRLRAGTGGGTTDGSRDAGLLVPPPLSSREEGRWSPHQVL